MIVKRHLNFVLEVFLDLVELFAGLRTVAFSFLMAALFCGIVGRGVARLSGKSKIHYC